MRKKVVKIMVFVLAVLIIVLAFLLAKEYSKPEELSVEEEYVDEGINLDKILNKEDKKNSDEEGQLYIDGEEEDISVEGESSQKSKGKTKEKTDSENRQEQTGTDVEIEEIEDDNVEFNPWG